MSKELEQALDLARYRLEEIVEAYEQRLEEILVQFMAGLGRQE